MNFSRRAPADGWQRALFWPLCSFTLGGTVLTLIGEAFKRHLIWYIRFADMMELVGLVLLYLITLMLLGDLFVTGNTSRGLRRLFLILALVFLFGHGMRVASNSVNTFSTEIRDYRGIIPNDMYALIYFFDETLAHIVLYTARYALFACLLGLEVGYLATGPRPAPHWAGLAVGILFGLWEAVVFVEGQKVLLAPFLAVGLGAAWLWLWRRSGHSFGPFLRTGPMTAFALAEVPSLLVGLVLYAALTGGFTQPSEMTWVVSWIG